MDKSRFGINRIPEQNPDMEKSRNPSFDSLDYINKGRESDPSNTTPAQEHFMTILNFH